MQVSSASQRQTTLVDFSGMIWTRKELFLLITLRDGCLNQWRIQTILKRGVLLKCRNENEKYICTRNAMRESAFRKIKRLMDKGSRNYKDSLTANRAKNAPFKALTVKKKLKNKRTNRITYLWLNLHNFISLKWSEAINPVKSAENVISWIIFFQTVVSIRNLRYALTLDVSSSQLGDLLFIKLDVFKINQLKFDFCFTTGRI